tara:strand:- start:168 stop:524 length:357 start_codon:yes stop_codon:yes gene_type:complete
MQVSSPRFKALAVTAGFTFWFFIITNSIAIFSLELLALFVSVLGVSTQIFAKKLSKVLDIFALFNTKVFLSLLFIFLISVYGILFKIQRIDLLRLKKRNDTYWLEMEQLKPSRIKKQY